MEVFISVAICILILFVGILIGMAYSLFKILSGLGYRLKKDQTKPISKEVWELIKRKEKNKS